MATYLLLEGARILEAQGFEAGTPSGRPHTVKFDDEGVFELYSRGLFGLKKIYRALFVKLEFYVGTVAAQIGDGWVGDSLGMESAVTASRLCDLTTRNRDYAVLTVVDVDSTTGTQKMISVGFQNIDETALRNKLAQAIPVWTEPADRQLEDFFN